MVYCMGEQKPRSDLEAGIWRAGAVGRLGTGAWNATAGREALSDCAVGTSRSRGRGDCRGAWAESAHVPAVAGAFYTRGTGRLVGGGRGPGAQTAGGFGATDS